jgi:nicotinate-nucleotide pyrophosphorylase (carboxylating)
VKPAWAPPPHLEPSDYRDLVRRALEEDVGTGDITTNAIVEAGARARAVFLAQSPCVIAGLDVAGEVFRQMDNDCRADFRVQDGDHCSAGTVIGEVAGNARALLGAERTALNFLQHLSGIATLTRQFVEAVAGRLTILDTRKTLPTLRRLEKYAVRVGGGVNHRLGLDGGILIKDNHVALAGGVEAAIARVRAAGIGGPVEVETKTLDEVDAALAAGADILLLDNMSIEMIREAVRRVAGRARTEVSGGVTLKNLSLLAQTGADSVSSGALTHSAPAADISLEIESA